MQDLDTEKKKLHLLFLLYFHINRILKSLLKCIGWLTNAFIQRHYLTTTMIPSVASTVNINNKYLLHEYCKSHKRQEITLRKFINNCSLLVHSPSPTRLTIEILSILIKLM